MAFIDRRKERPVVKSFFLATMSTSGLDTIFLEPGRTLSLIGTRFALISRVGNVPSQNTAAKKAIAELGFMTTMSTSGLGTVVPKPARMVSLMNEFRPIPRCGDGFPDHSRLAPARHSTLVTMGLRSDPPAEFAHPEDRVSTGTNE
jgi:hypothetical protein